MKYKVKEEHFSLLATLVIVVMVAISFRFLLENYSVLKNVISDFMTLLFPFIIGFSIAFLLNKPMMALEAFLFGKTTLKPHVKRVLSVIIVMVLAILIIAIFFWIIVPSMITSLQSLIEQAPTYVAGFENFILDLMKRYEINGAQITQLLGISEKDVFAQLTIFVQDVLPQLITYSISLTSSLFNVILGIMAGAYMLLEKERFVNGIKQALLILFPKHYGAYFIMIGGRANLIFNNFIVGKAIDSLIIGILCYVGMQIFQFPYALLISVFIGVTNMIPVFGPFIGAIPGLIILTIIHPINFVYFGLFVLALQQLDGNVIGPLILGDKLGMPSLFILFAVVVGGGLFGIVGMFIGVPVFALLISMVKEYLAAKEQRNQALKQ